MNKNFLTVAEFAEKTGVSRQTVYNRINSDLADCKKIINGKTYIDHECFDKFDNQFDKSLDSFDSEIDSGVDNMDKRFDSFDKSKTEIISLQLKLHQERIKNAEITSELKAKEVLTKSLQNQLDSLIEQFDKLFDKLNQREQEFDKLVDKLSSHLLDKDKEVNSLISQITLLFDQQQQLQFQLQAQLLPQNQQEKKSFWQRIFNK